MTMKSIIKKSWVLGVLLGLSLMTFGQTQEEVVFSAPGGFYETSFPLSLECLSDLHHVRYTNNGSRPTANSLLYSEPLVLDEHLYSKSNIYTILNCPEENFYLPDSVRHCIVIRAAVFDENDSCVSAVKTNSYYIRALGCDTHGLPAISLCADSLDLFDYEQGIMVPGIHFDSLYPGHTGNYYQKGREWERLANVEYCDIADNDGINQLCGLRTHGNRARRQPQKGLKIYAREEYGNKRFDYRFFEETTMNSFKHLLIKPFSSLYPFTGIQDYICCQMAIGIGLEAGYTRPVCLYINGEYWGIYFLQEKMDERYLEDHLGVDHDECNIISNWMEPECGNPQGFYDMMLWLESADLTIQENYDYLSALVDIDNFIDYMVFETFVANLDWPANNNRCWQMEGGKWRWMFYDGDATFNNSGVDPFGNPTVLDVFGNATYTGDYFWPSSRRATLLFRRLLENQDFYDSFDQRIHELCQTVFLYEQTSPWYHHIRGLLYHEIDEQSYRWGNPSSRAYWTYACSLTDVFLKERVDSYLIEWGSFTTTPQEHQNAFRCYPNPAKDILVVETQGASPLTPTEYRITNLMGQNLLQGHINDTIQHIHIESLPAGIYIITLGTATKKLVVR